MYPVHPNPNVYDTAHRLLQHPRIRLVRPLRYSELLNVLSRSHIVLTDSGGIQEEAPSFGKPVIVLRQVTERPEAVMAGTALLAGTDERRIVKLTQRLLDDSKRYRRMTSRENPFGDGCAAGRIIKSILHYFRLGPKPQDWHPQK